MYIPCWIVFLGRMAVKLEIDKLDVAQKEGRASWTDVVHESKTVYGTMMVIRLLKDTV